MYKAVFLLLLLICLNFGVSQTKVKELYAELKYFKDRGSENEGYYRWPEEGYLTSFGQSGMGAGGYNCYEVADTSTQPLPSYPDNLGFIVEDSTKIGLKVFLYSCGLEMLSQAGQGSVDNFFIVFEKERKQVVDLLLGGRLTSYGDRVTKTMRSVVRSFERITYGVYSFIRVSQGSEGYTEEYFLFSVTVDGINQLVRGIPITYYCCMDAYNKAPQLQVVVNWPNSIEVKALTDELWPGQEKWIGTYYP